MSPRVQCEKWTSGRKLQACMVGMMSPFSYYCHPLFHTGRDEKVVRILKKIIIYTLFLNMSFYLSRFCVVFTVRINIFVQQTNPYCADNVQLLYTLVCVYSISVSNYFSTRAWTKINRNKKNNNKDMKINISKLHFFPAFDKL